jgi:serine/threonine-protein kinase
VIGKTLAHYKITRKIGAGGMGEVYRATDSKLGRDVALKMLPAEFAQDPERMARFHREAQVLASLNHANIGAIYGLEEHDGSRFLVLELIEGPTLFDRLRSGPVPREDALRIAQQIAEAVEFAHENGVMHRDLKPANVKLTEGGHVKVLDFGLAKALEDPAASASGAGDPAESPTMSPTLSPTLQSPITGALTAANVILGTAAYMSPEQARGKPIDKRADIWAFGVILWEMLTGQRLFDGETVSDTLAAVLRKEPDWNALPADTSPRIRRLVRRCLERNPKQRLRDIGDARVVLDEVLRGDDGPERPARRIGPAVAAAFFAGVVVAALTAWALRPGPEPRPVRRFLLATPDASVTTPATTIALSADGQQIAYSSQGKLWIRDFSTLEPRVVTGAEGAFLPFWSPDGTRLGFFLGREIRKVAVAGGETIVVCESPEPLDRDGGGSWLRDDRIVFSTGNGSIFEVPAQGGDPRSILEPVEDVEHDFHNASAAIDGQGTLFVTHRNEGVDTIEWLADGRRTLVVRHEGYTIRYPVYDPAGYVLYQRFGTNEGLWEQRFSLKDREPRGSPRLIVPGCGVPSVAADGTLAYVRPSSRAGTHELVRVDRQGKVVEALGSPADLQPWPILSPDGTRAAIQQNTGDGGDVWIHDLERRTHTRLTFSDDPEAAAAWSSDGRWVVYLRWGGSMDSSAVMARRADGSGEPRTLVMGAYWASLSPDGRTLAYSKWGEGSGMDIWAVPLDADFEPGGDPFLFAGGPGGQRPDRFSPDGKYLAYNSTASGEYELFVRPFPEGPGRWQVSANGGAHARWTRDGRELLYMSEDGIMAVPVEYDPSFHLGPAQLLFELLDPIGTNPLRLPDAFEVFADGEHIILLRRIQSNDLEVPDPKGVVVVQNWRSHTE